jgi:hypothetical protein
VEQFVQLAFALMIDYEKGKVNFLVPRRVLCINLLQLKLKISGDSPYINLYERITFRSPRAIS